MTLPTKSHTSNRDTFAKLIQNFGHPFTAKDISFATTATDQMSITTIYRLLDEFETSGQLRKELGADGSAIYYYLQPCHDKGHFLLECQRCHQISHVDCKQLHKFTKHISQKHNFEVSDYQLLIKGICAECREES